MYVAGSPTLRYISVMRRGICGALAFLSAGVAFQLGGIISAASAQTPETAGSTEGSISDEACRRLVRHVPDADVAYKPGVDVRGNSVAAAELPGTNTLKLPESIQFNLTVDVLSDYGVDDHSPLRPTGETIIGVVTFDLLSGALTFNGEPLGDLEQAVLAAACRKANQ